MYARYNPLLSACLIDVVGKKYLVSGKCDIVDIQSIKFQEFLSEAESHAMVSADVVAGRSGSFH